MWTIAFQTICFSIEYALNLYWKLELRYVECNVEFSEKKWCKDTLRTIQLRMFNSCCSEVMGGSKWRWVEVCSGKPGKVTLILTQNTYETRFLTKQKKNWICYKIEEQPTCLCLAAPACCVNLLQPPES